MYAIASNLMVLIVLDICKWVIDGLLLKAREPIVRTGIPFTCVGRITQTIDSFISALCKEELSAPTVISLPTF